MSSIGHHSLYSLEEPESREHLFVDRSGQADAFVIASFGMSFVTEFVVQDAERSPLAVRS